MLTASEYDLKIATGGRSPRISMNHSYTTGYSDVRQKILGLDPNDGSIHLWQTIHSMNNLKITEVLALDLL